MKMKCPICGKIYETPSIAKICPLRHCPNCGSTGLQNFFEDPESQVTLLIFLFGIMGLILGPCLVASSFYQISPDLPDWNLLLSGIVIAGVGLFLIILCFYFFICETCGKNFILGRKNIPLEPIDAAIKKCRKCGATMPSDAKFCGICGSKLK